MGSSGASACSTASLHLTVAEDTAMIHPDGVDRIMEEPWSTAKSSSW